MKKTSSVAPLVLAIIGMVFGFLGFACIAICAEAADKVEEAIAELNVNVQLAKVASWLTLAGSVVALVGGCCARSKNWGPLVLLLGTLVVLVAFVLLFVAKYGFDFCTFVALVLFAVGALVALVKKAE